MARILVDSEKTLDASLAAVREATTAAMAMLEVSIALVIVSDETTGTLVSFVS